MSILPILPLIIKGRHQSNVYFAPNVQVASQGKIDTAFSWDGLGTGQNLGNIMGMGWLTGLL